MKCDETSLSCRNCLAAGWKCDGCSPSLSNPLQTPGIVSYAIPFRVPGSQKERQALHYYCVQGCSDIAGYMDSEFWSHEVLRASHHESIVRQALVSLSLLQLESASSDGIKAAGSEALVRYGKALRALNRSLQDPSSESVRTALLCCVLFYCFETAQGQPENAVRHLESGLNILSQTSHILPGYQYQGNSPLYKIFRRLDLQATIFNQERKPVLAQVLNTVCGWPDSTPRERFLNDAFDELVMIQSALFRFLVPNTLTRAFPLEAIPVPILSGKNKLVDLLDQWKKNVDRFEVASQSSSQSLESLKVLTIQWHICHMLLASVHPLDDTVFGASPNPETKTVLDLITDVLATQGCKIADGNVGRTLRRTCSAETGIVAPLFMICMKCSDSAVRRRAAELLEKADRREGLYDSRNVLAIVHKFETAKRQDESLNDRITDLSLEDCFPAGLATAIGTMDHLADFLET